MVRPMRYRDIKRALTANGCTSRQGRGDHEVWYCPCGKHVGVVTQAREVSPGVVADLIKKLGCLPEGWLQ